LAPKRADARTREPLLEALEARLGALEAIVASQPSDLSRLRLALLELTGNVTRWRDAEERRSREEDERRSREEDERRSREEDERRARAESVSQLEALREEVTALRASLDTQRTDLKDLTKTVEAVKTLTSGRAPALKRLDAKITAVDRRLARVGMRVERHLSPIERQSATARARRDPDFARFFDVANPIVSSDRTLLDYDRLYVLWNALRNAAGSGLPVAEVGVYRGGSARFIAETLRAFGVRGELHLFDTFAGHPPESLTPLDSDSHQGTDVFDDTSVADVQKYLASYDSVFFHVGAFADSIGALGAEQWAFVHLDVDLYKPTLEGLRYFGDRLPAGGVIVVDDYGTEKTGGIILAVSEFMDERQDFQLWPRSQQAVLVKVGAGRRRRSKTKATA
jgi:uncharacterized coiled-coil protein SlyX